MASLKVKLKLLIVFIACLNSSCANQNPAADQSVILEEATVQDSFPSNLPNENPESSQKAFTQAQRESNGPELDNEEDHEEEENNIKVPYSHSPIYLTYLAKAEQTVYKDLMKYENELKKRLQILQDYRKDYEDSVVNAVNQKGSSETLDEWSKAAVVASHPFLAFRMIRRFSKHLKDFIDHIWRSLENDVWNSLEKARGKADWPAESDFDSAAKSIIRIQNTHDFDIHFFAAGVIRDYKSQTGLTAKQCLELSKVALDTNDVFAATEWFQVAHSKSVQSRDDNTVGMDELTIAWETTYKAFQTIWPLHIFKTHDVFGESKALLREDFERLKVNRTYEHRIVNFKALCRGDRLRSLEEEANLVCYFDPFVHPYWLLQPLRMEVHNWEPIIYQIHDFIPAQDVMNINIENFIPTVVSSVLSGATANQNIHGDRSFTYTWFQDESARPSLQRLTAKLKMLTHRLGDNGPLFHIATHAVGNHYEPCVQCLEIDTNVHQYGTPKHVVRVVIQEPDQGGELAFTLLGAVVKPVRGSLIIYNLIGENGEFDYRILHGSCPVVLGQKWEATKWVYDYNYVNSNPEDHNI